jgi:hypothetical protein
MLERNSRNTNNTIGYTRNVSKSRDQQQETIRNLKDASNIKMPATVWMQATAVTQATTPATSNIKDDSNIMTAHNSRNASNSRNESNNRTANIVWTLSKARMLAKTVKPATAWRETNSSRDNRNITASAAEGRPPTTKMPEIVETSQQQY